MSPAPEAIAAQAEVLWSDARALTECADRLREIEVPQTELARQMVSCGVIFGLRGNLMVHGVSQL